MSQELNDKFAEALVELANALDEWKNAGADSLTVVSAIQNFVDVKIRANSDPRPQ